MTINGYKSYLFDHDEVNINFRGRDDSVIINNNNAQQVTKKKALEISNSNKHNKFILQSLNNGKVNKLIFKNCNDLVVSVEERANISKIEFHECSINKVVIEGHSEVSRIAFYKCSINLLSIDESTIGDSGMYFDENSTINVLDIDGCTISGLIEIERVALIKAMKITNTIFRLSPEQVAHGHIHSIRLEGTTIDSLEIRANMQSSGIAFIKTKIIDGAIRLSTIKNIMFKNRLYDGSSLLIEDVKCFRLEFDNFVNFGKLIFRNIYSRVPSKNKNVPFGRELIIRFFKKLYLSIKLTTKIIRHGNNTSESENKYIIKIHNSDLGNSQFIGCHISSDWVYDFRNSKLLDILILDSFLPEKPVSDLRSNDYRPYINSNLQGRLLFDQLRKVYEKNGDSVKAAMYRKLSLDEYLRYLRSKNKKTWRQKADILSLWLNKYSNDYGYRLSRAILVFLCMSITLYMIYLYLLNMLHWNSTFDFDQALNLCAFYFDFVNPIHKSTFIYEYPDSTARICDGISRIIITYLLYQLVQSFRRFGKGD